MKLISLLLLLICVNANLKIYNTVGDYVLKPEEYGHANYIDIELWSSRKWWTTTIRAGYYVRGAIKTYQQPFNITVGNSPFVEPMYDTTTSIKNDNISIKAKHNWLEIKPDTGDFLRYHGAFMMGEWDVGMVIINYTPINYSECFNN